MRLIDYLFAAFILVVSVAALSFAFGFEPV